MDRWGSFFVLILSIGAGQGTQYDDKLKLLRTVFGRLKRGRYNDTSLD